ncbi:MAG TPA: ATP-binding protein [Acidimicrobiales bacterium]|nr:ATP-binding protein [Acidimicrobiales bacterium]
MCLRAHLTVPGTSLGPARTRRALRQHLGDVGHETLDDLVLVASELVTNALEARAQVIGVEVWVHHGRVQVTVNDSAPGMPTPVCAGEDEVRGRGLAIVGALAASWEVHPEPRGKTIASTVVLPRPPPPSLAHCGCEACSCWT